MKDSLAETSAPAVTSAVPPIRKSADMRHHNFFPFSLLWFSIVALEISVLAGLRIAEADIWFHLRNAQELLTRHSFLRTELYTFTTAGAPLLDHQWLSELPYWISVPRLRSAWPAGGVRRPSVADLRDGLLPGTAARRNNGDAALVTMAGVALGCYSFGPRTHHFGVALPGRSAPRAGTFSANRQGTLGATAAIRPMDQLAWLLGFWVCGDGSIYRFRPGGRPMEPCSSRALDAGTT